MSNYSLEESSLSYTFPNNITNIFNIEEENLLPSNLLSESSIETTPVKHTSSSRASTKSMKMNTLSANHNYYLFFDLSFFFKQIQSKEGSVLLQENILSFPKPYLNQLLSRLSPYISLLMISTYGNYFIQKLLQRLNYHQRLFFISAIHPNFIQICIDKFGTHSIQALLDSLTTIKEEKIFEELIKPHLFFLITNTNSNHLIQKIILKNPEYKRLYLTTFILENMNAVAVNEYGAVVLMKYISMNNDLLIRKQLIKVFENWFNVLVANQYSVKVLLYVFEKYGPMYCGFIINPIKSNMVYYSMQNHTYLLVIKVIDYLYACNIDEFTLVSNLFISNVNIIKHENPEVMMMKEGDNIDKVMYFIKKRQGIKVETKNSSQQSKPYNNTFVDNEKERFSLKPLYMNKTNEERICSINDSLNNY